MAEYFRDVRGPGRAALHRQHLPLRAGRLGSVGAARPHAVAPWATSRRWPPRWVSCRSASPPPTRARSLRCRPSTCPPTISPTRRRPPPSPTWTRPRCSRARSSRNGHLPSRRPAGLDLAHPATRASSARSTTHGARGVQQVLQRYKDLQDIIAILGMDELSDEDKLAVAAGAQDPAVPVPAVPRRRGIHRHAGPVRAARRHDPRVSRRCWTASTTTLPEQAFYIVGGIDDVVSRAEELRGAAA